MNWLSLLFEVAKEALTAWRTRTPAEPVASQRDIAIGVASSEAARREGKIAPTLTKSALNGVRFRQCSHCRTSYGVGHDLPEVCPRCQQLEDTWPGER